MKDKIKTKILDRWNLTLEEEYDKIFINDGKKKYKKYLFKCNRCGYEWRQGIRFDRNLSCPMCYPSSHGSSAGELELYNYFLTTGLNVVHNDRKVLDGKEIDIYLPELKIGIEYDGEFWHNKQKDNEKNLIAENKGIKLLRVCDKDFIRNKENVLEYLEKEINVKFGKIKEIKTFTQKASKIICLQNMKIYESYKEVSIDLGLKNLSNILNVCNGNLKSCKGYKFEYYDENKKYKKIEKKYGYNYKKVKCLETGKVYAGILDAQRQTGIKTISDCLNGKQKTAGGFHWVLTNEDVNSFEEVKQSKEKGKKIICLETKEVFESGQILADKLNVSKTAIYNAIKKEKPCKGKHYKYL